MNPLSNPSHASSPQLADFHRERLRDAVRQTPPAALISEFIPAERARWEAQSPAAREMLIELYRQISSELDNLLPTSYPGEVLLAQASWERLLANAPITSSWPVEPNRLADLLRTLEGKGQLQEHVFASNTPIIGSLVARIRRLWYNVAARWAVQTLAQQQETFNSEFLDILGTVERSVIENDRAITQLRRRIAELETRQQSGDGQ